MKKQFGQRKTPVCKAPIKMSEPCNKKILFTQFRNCMYVIQKTPFPSSRNLTFCYPNGLNADIMLHQQPTDTPQRGCRWVCRTYSMCYMQLPIPTRDISLGFSVQCLGVSDNTSTACVSVKTIGIVFAKSKFCTNCIFALQRRNFSDKLSVNIDCASEKCK